MFHLPSVLSGALVATTLLALAPLATRWTANEDTAFEPIAATRGRVQLASDEHDIGVTDDDTPLEVCFAVSNTGSEPLLLRQARSDSTDHTDPPFPLYTVSPGRTIAVAARLNSNDLAPRCRKHVRFLTSDPTSPELWLTIRGAVASAPAER